MNFPLITVQLNEIKNERFKTKKLVMLKNYITKCP